MQQIFQILVDKAKQLNFLLIRLNVQIDKIFLLIVFNLCPGLELPDEWETGLLRNTTFGIGTGTDDGPQLEVYYLSILSLFIDCSRTIV